MDFSITLERHSSPGKPCFWFSDDSRVGDRGFWLQTGCAAMVISCDEADEGGFWVGSGRRGSVMGTKRLSEEARKGLKRDGRAVGGEGDSYRRLKAGVRHHD
jgi:hypothetical protein